VPLGELNVSAGNTEQRAQLTYDLFGPVLALAVAMPGDNHWFEQPIMFAGTGRRSRFVEPPLLVAADGLCIHDAPAAHITNLERGHHVVDGSGRYRQVGWLTRRRFGGDEAARRGWLHHASS
jgi:hypothetical protein